jgi:REP element-mobilizing transposase RayT
MSEYKPKGWYSRGYLPHFDGSEICQFITLHQGDVLPQKVVERWKIELEHEKDEQAKITFYKRVENYLHQGYGKCFLRNEEIAERVQNSLLFFDTVRYKLLAWVIMPNHIHFLLTPNENHSLSEIIHSIKSYTSQKANKILRRKGKFWEEDYFDRYIRNYEHFEQTVAYIENNPVKARLCEKASDWKFSSAYFLKK